MRISKTTGRAFCMQPKQLCVMAGADRVLWDRNQYLLRKPVLSQDGELYLPWEDLQRLLLPEVDVCLDAAAGMAVLHSADAPDADAGISVACRNLGDGVTGIGIRDALHGKLGWPEAMGGPVCVIGFSGQQPEIPKNRRLLEFAFAERHTGELFRTVWLSEFNVLNSYRLYVPTDWEARAEHPMVVCLHGAGGNENNCFDRAEGKLSYYAEKYGYLVLAPNSVVVRSNFGGLVPPSGQFRAPRFQDAEGRPQYYPPEEQMENQLVESCVLRLLKDVTEEFSVDPQKVYLMGNSMGGIGTFYLGGRYPAIFRALAPSGAIPEPAAQDWSVYGQKPILYIAGTEDHNGFEKMQEDFRTLRTHGLNIRMLPVGGGVHSTAWTWEIPAIFDFFRDSTGISPNVKMSKCQENNEGV